MALNIIAKGIAAGAALAAFICSGASLAPAAEAESGIAANSSALNSLSQEVRSISDAGREEVGRRLFDALAGIEVRFRADSGEAAQVKSVRGNLLKGLYDPAVPVTKTYSAAVDKVGSLKVPSGSFNDVLAAMHDTAGTIGILDREADALISLGVSNSSYANYREAMQYFEQNYEGVYDLVRTVPARSKEQPANEASAEGSDEEKLPSIEEITALISDDVRRSLEASGLLQVSVNDNAAVVEALQVGGYMLGTKKVDKTSYRYVMSAIDQAIKDLKDPMFSSPDIKGCADMFAEAAKNVSSGGCVRYSDRSADPQYEAASLEGTLDTLLIMNPVPKDVKVSQINDINNIMLGIQAAKDIKTALKNGATAGD